MVEIQLDFGVRFGVRDLSDTEILVRYLSDLDGRPPRIKKGGFSVMQI